MPESSSLASEPSAPAAERSPRQHVLDYRISVPLLGQRVYIVFFAGVEARSLARLRRQGQLRAFWPLAIKAVLLSAIVVTVAATLTGATVIGLYLMKSFAGINLFDGPSPLHDWFF